MKKLTLFPLNYAERKQIQILLNQSIPLIQIAKIMSRSKTCITQEVRRNGGREIYTADAAEQRALHLIESRPAYSKKIYVLTLKILDEKIKMIQMQIEILSDTLKELLNDRKN